MRGNILLPQTKLLLMQKKNSFFTVFLILFLGAFLRLWYLGARSLRLEEIFLKDLIQQADWQSFFKSFHDLVGYGWNPLNPFFCRLIAGMGSEDLVLRLPAALFGIFSIYILYRLGKSLFSEKTALTATILFSLSPMAVAWSQDARYFSLALFLSLSSAWFLVEALRARKWAWAGFVLMQVAFFLTTYQGGVILVMEGFFLFLLILFPPLRREGDQDPGKSFIYFLISLFIIFILLYPWLNYEINNDFRMHKVVKDIYASGGSVKNFLDWGGGNMAGFLFCLSFFLFQLIGAAGIMEPEEGGAGGAKTIALRIREKYSKSLLPLLLAGLPGILGLAGVLRGDQIFFGLPFFLLVAAEGMNQAAAVLESKKIKCRWILPGFLSGYLLLQIMPFYYLQTGRRLSFIPKPDWRAMITYFLPSFRENQTILLDYQRDRKTLFRHLVPILRHIMKDQQARSAKLSKFPWLIYAEKPEDIFFKSLSRDKYRTGYFIQTPKPGKISALLDDPLFSSFFTFTVSFPGLNVYRYRLPTLVWEDTRSYFDEKINNMTLTQSQELHKPVLFLKPGDYLLAFQTRGNLAGRFSISINKNKTLKVSTDSNGHGSLRIQTGRELQRIVFQLIEPDILQLEWFGIYRLRNDKIEFQIENFHYMIPEKNPLLIKVELESRTAMKFYVNSSVGYYFAVKEGGRFMLKLEGLDAKVGPIEIAVELDGKEVGIFSFDKADDRWSSRQMPLSLSAGVHQISFSFINDLRNEQGDRNAFLDRFELHRIPLPGL
jgi:4-amino-4-deoxy-L-arabinose transferase-like glycosyltransferase